MVGCRLLSEPQHWRLDQAKLERFRVWGLGFRVKLTAGMAVAHRPSGQCPC